jgi:MFS transporter, UMF1 family
MKLFVYLGAFSCMGLFFFTGNNIELGIILCITASIGFSGSLVFYDAFLPEIVTSDRYDRTSARGYTWGYIGSVILMILCLVLIEGYEVFGFPDKGLATRFSFLLVGFWWLGFSQISFYFLPDNVFNRKVTGRILFEGHKELLKVWRNLKAQAQLKKYLLSFFFFNMGVQTVMYLAATFGSKELKLPAEKLILTVLLIQMVAAIGATFFARLSEKVGNKSTLQIMIVMWIFICLAAYFVRLEYQFYALAFFVGLVMGGIQSLSRATYSKMIPTSTISHASYFSFYDVTYNLSIVFGTFSYGLVEQLTGSMRNSTLALMSFFIIGLLFLSLTTVKPVKEYVSNADASQ